MHQSFNEFIKNNLNPSQQQAVEHELGSVLVVAGAGSGKTRVITARITHLIINKNVPASSITALTFTNKAANEMKERIASFLGTHKDLPFVGTFHSYCVQFLKKHQEFLETPFTSILDSDDQQKMIQGILHRSGLQKQFTPKSVAHHISQMKNHTIDPNSTTMDYLPHPLLTDIFNTYEHEKKMSRCLDFDDLLLETLKLLKKNQIVKTRFQEKIRHILVDEYQDTNVVQHELLKAMTLKNTELAIDSVCAVGDEDQSIYSWRGATVTNMTNFKYVFPNTRIITIDQNYRSIQEILTIANTTIQNNISRTPKTLWSEKTGSNRVKRLTCLTEYQEARAIAQCLLIAKEKYSLNTIGILYRTHTQSRAIEEALLKESIPYRIIGGIQFYERKEIKDLLAYLKIIANPFDRVSFFRILNVPTRGLGEKCETHLYEKWNHEPFASWQEIIMSCIKEQTFGKSKTDILQKFTDITKNITAQSLTSFALEQIIIRTDYILYIKESCDPQEAQTRLDNIKELLDAIKHFEKNGTTTIAQFLDEVALMQDQMSKQNRDTHAVSLMTLHAAKGLEFSMVILPGLEEGIIPTTRSLNLNASTEEERRLFYVGITRAKEQLLIMHSKNRYSYGQLVTQSPSRFLLEVQSLIPHEDCSYWNITQINQFFAQWFGTKTITPSHVYVPAKETPKKIESIAQHASSWRKNQPVKHEKYGIGTIQDIEQKGSGETCLTVRFKSSIKKILSQFIKRI